MIGAVGHPVTVCVQCATLFIDLNTGRSFGATIGTVGHPVTVCVQRTALVIDRGIGRGPRTVVFAVDDTVLITILFAVTFIDRYLCRGIRITVFPVRHTVMDRVRLTTRFIDHNACWRSRAAIPGIGNTITISIKQLIADSKDQIVYVVSEERQGIIAFNPVTLPIAFITEDFECFRKDPGLNKAVKVVRGIPAAKASVFTPLPVPGVQGIDSAVIDRHFIPVIPGIHDGKRPAFKLQDIDIRGA